jgi:hypothetical protein
MPAPTSSVFRSTRGPSPPWKPWGATSSAVQSELSAPVEVQEEVVRSARKPA